MTHKLINHMTIYNSKPRFPFYSNKKKTQSYYIQMFSHQHKVTNAIKHKIEGIHKLVHWTDLIPQKEDNNKYKIRLFLVFKVVG